jgi:hypothetical protein
VAAVGTDVTDAVWIFAAVLAFAFLAAAALACRRYLLERSGGTVECGLRFPVGSGNWRLGVLSYQRDELGWYGALGVLLRPERVFKRRGLSVVSRRPAGESETVTLGADRIIVEVLSGHADGVGPGVDAAAGESAERFELAMSEEALTGFLAWIEASPPGSHLTNLALAQAGPGSPEAAITATTEYLISAAR